MKVHVEGIIHNFSSKALNNSWADEIPNIIVRVINAITLSENKEGLRSAINKIAEETELDKFFVYGYGTHHFWLTHLRLSNGEPMEQRLLIAEF